MGGQGVAIAGFLGWPRRHLGRRGAVLHLAGLAWAFYGLAVASGIELGPFDVARPAVPFEWSNPRWWGWGWVAVGLFTAVGALVNRRNARFEDVSWAVLILPPLVWASLYFWTGLVHVVSGAPLSLGWWALTGFWAVVVTITRIISGWDEPVAELGNGGA